MKKMTFLVLITCVISIHICSAQNDTQVKLFDIQSKEPVSFATVRFVGSTRGIVADYYGYFRLPNTLLKAISELKITAIGYETLTVTVKDLRSDVLNNLQMRPRIESLDAVVLDVSRKSKMNSAQLADIIGAGRSLFATEIVRKAIDAIPKNLSTKPHSYIGYYRDYQFLDNEYFNLNEGVIEQYDDGIDTNLLVDSRNQKAFYYFGTNKEFTQDKDLAKSYDNEFKYIQNARLLGYGGNEYTILQMHNPIRNYNINTFSYVYQMNRDFLANHEFSKGKIEFLEEEPIITILFNTKSKKNTGYGARNQVNQTPYHTFSESSSINYTRRISPDHPANGRIAISLLDFSVHEFNYTLYDNSEENVMFNIVLEYQKRNDKMYLNFLSFNNRFLTGDTDIFKEDYVEYIKEENVFKVRFNRPVALNTLKKRNFKIYFNKRKLPIDNLKIENAKTVVLALPDYEQSVKELENDNTDDLKVSIKGVRDVNGKKIYKDYPTVAYQFREFFIQQINISKNLDNSLQYVDKTRPLTVAPVNNVMETTPFILNSPLQKRELQSRQNRSKASKFE